MIITEKDFLYDIILKYPETKEYFLLNGLRQVEDEKLLSTFGKSLSLSVLIKSKKLNKNIF